MTHSLRPLADLCEHEHTEVTMKKALLSTVFVALLVAGVAIAQDDSGRFGVGLDFGYWKQIGGDHDYSNVDQFGGLRLSYGLSPRWSMVAGLQYGWTRPGVTTRLDDAGLTLDTGAGFYTKIWQPSLNAVYAMNPGGRWLPWVSGGVGVTRWDIRDLRGVGSPGLFPDGAGLRVFDKDGNRVDGHGVNVTGIVGVGVDYAISDNFRLGLAGRYNYLLSQDNDSVGLSALWGAGHVDANNGIVEVAAAATILFGSSVKDSDGDGIIDKLDACPDQPEDMDGFEDTDGCPDLDNDQDGIPDTVDAAPNEPEDKDGFEDEDGAPDPDNDRDGILDVNDKCPNVAEDKDGFQDDDGCPDPDNDGDGVLDAQDKCPDTPRGVKVDANGCPEVKEIKDALRLEGVNFKTGSAELLPGSQTVLDGVAESLKAWPNVNIEIAGHTDSTGSAETNKKLSQKRAESVMAYLVEAGVAGNRMRAVGYGEDRPIADNGNAAGRAMNRRVEITRTN